MANIVVSEFITLDGVVEAPNEWSRGFWTDEIAKFKFDELFSSDALLLGKVTYQGFAAAWPSMKDEAGYADRMNGLPKYVVSATLATAGWNNSRIIAANAIEEIAKLRQEPGQTLLIFGSGMLVEALRQGDLVDEYRLLTYPVVVGHGRRFFTSETKTALRLVEAQAFSSGAVLTRYQPDRK